MGDNISQKNQLCLPSLFCIRHKYQGHLIQKRLNFDLLSENMIVVIIDTQGPQEYPHKPKCS